MTTNDRKITHIHIHLASRQIDRKISNLDTEELSSVWKIPHEILPSRKSTNIRRNYKMTKSSRKKTTNTSLFKGAFVYLFIFFLFWGGGVTRQRKKKSTRKFNGSISLYYKLSFLKDNRAETYLLSRGSLHFEIFVRTVHLIYAGKRGTSRMHSRCDVTQRFKKVVSRNQY